MPAKHDWDAILTAQPKNDWSFLNAKPSAPVATPFPEPTLRQMAGENTTPEQALESGAVANFLEQLRAKAETMEPDSDERKELASRIAGLQSDLGEFERQQREAKKQGVTRETLGRLESPVGAFEKAISQQAVGQTLMRAEQGLSNIAETGLSLGSRTFGDGRMSANIHRDKKLRDEFLTTAEQGGDVQKYLGESGSRIYNGIVTSLSKNAAIGTLAGPSAVYSMIAGESYDDGLEEARVHGMSGPAAQLYAGSKAGIETGLTLLFGKAGKRLGIETLEESFSPAMKKAVANMAGKAVGKQLPKLAKELAGVGLESGEEFAIDAVQQGVELFAGTSKGFNWQRLLEATAAGAGARGSAGVAKNLSEALRKIPSANIDETIRGVAVAEQAVDQLRAKAAAPAVPDPVAATLATPEDQSAFEKIAAHQVQVEGAAGARGLNSALSFIKGATPEMLQAVSQPLSQKEFAKITGLKKTSELFRAAFRDTLGVYSTVVKGAPADPTTSPDGAQAATQAVPLPEQSSTTEPAAQPAPAASATPAPATPAKPTADPGKVRSWLKEHFSSAGLRNAEIDGANDVRIGELASELMKADQLRSDLDGAVKSAFGGGRRQFTGFYGQLFSETDTRDPSSEGRNGLTADQVQQLDDAIKGKPTNLPVEVLAAIKPLRAHVDSLSRKLLDSGVVDPESELGLTIDENMGAWMTRTYRKHDQKTWPQVAKQNADLMDRARAWLKTEFPDDAADVTEWRLNTMLDKDSAAAKAPAGVSKQDRDFMSVLKERKELPEIVRELYGEYRDPWINYTKSIAKMANLMAHKNFMGTVKAAGLANGFLSDEKSPRPENYRQIDSTQTPRLAELNGLYASENTVKALQDLFNADAHSLPYRYAMKVNGLSHAMSTIANSKTYVRNFLGNIQGAMANGDLFSGPETWGIATRTAWDHVFRNGGVEGQRQYLRELATERVIDSDVDVGFLNDMVAEMADLDGAPRVGLLGAMGKGWKKAARVYQALDTFWKINAYENKKLQYAKAYPDESEAAVKKLAAADVRAHYPTYSKIAKGVKFVGKTPFYGPFLSFPAEVIRNRKNLLTTISREIRSDNPAVAEMGKQRLVGLVSSFALVPAISAISKAVHGITPQEEEDLRKFQPSWSQNAQFLYLGKDGKGKYDTVDLSFMDANNVITKPALAALRDGTAAERFERALPELFNPLGEDLLFKRVADVLRNRDSEGRRIWNPELPVEQKALRLSQHIGEPLVPGTAVQVERIRRGMMGEIRKGRPYDATLETAALFGYRNTPVDVPTSFGFRNREFKQRLENANSEILTVIQDSGTVTPGTIAHTYAMMNGQRQKIVKEWHDSAMAAIRLGVPEAVVRNELKSAGIDNAVDVLAGVARPYRPSPESMRTLATRPDGRARAMQMVQLFREATEQRTSAGNGKQ